MNTLRRFTPILVLLLAAITANSTTTTPYDCPKDCECIVIQGSRPQNHAKCTSLEGLHNVTHLPIHSIDLSHIGITKVGNFLTKLRDLDTVDISNNHLTDIPHVARRVHSLKLSHNKITSDKLVQLNSHIRDLDLSYNEITYLPLGFKELEHLRTVELAGNKINCSCDTLTVRNWLQEQRVYTDNHIKCALPHHIKGKPWLQIKQSEICDHEKLREIDNENDLMLGDEPVNDDELESDFIMVPKSNKKRETTKVEENPKDQVEGSGDIGVPLMEQKAEDAEEHNEEHDEDLEDGSGSGGGPISNFGVPEQARNILDSDDDFLPEDAYNNTVLSVPTLANPTMNEDPASDFERFALNITEFEEDTSPVPVKDSEIVKGVTGSEVSDESEKIVEANASEGTNNTYILLGIAILIIVGLILFVGIKRAKQSRLNRYDEENPRSTELADMDKDHLGKPIHKNGINENAPLIGEKTLEDKAKPMNGNGKPTYGEDGVDKKNLEPLLEEKPRENGKQNTLDVEPPVHMVIPRYPPPKSPRASKYNRDNDANNNDDDVFLPSSPKSGRYSPVYSPETGKVKIKLTETPRPKTPMLVNRSKSNAGEIITTPVTNNNNSNSHNNNYVH
ncbi:hypothetical protein ACFFRR_007394 [Megaselia abdita]